MQKKEKPDTSGYYMMITSSNKNFTLRKRMVLRALENGIKPTAKEFNTTVKTVRKWVRRFKALGNDGLKELSRKPRSSPNKTPPAIEQSVVQQRLKTPGFGAKRLVKEFDLPVSHNVANRIIKANGLTRSRRKKHHKKNDLRKVKAAYEAFTHFQMDVKHLCDLPKYWAQAKALDLPWFQYTIREVSTGAQFLTYSQELSKTYSTLTIERFLKHLKRFDIDTKKVIIKTDLGLEFDGETRNYHPESFHGTIEGLGATHLFNPPASPNFNADVESVHASIELEFYEAELFLGRDDFKDKSAMYQFWYNCSRQNSSREWKSPADILAKKDPKIDPRIFLLHPVFSETLLIPSEGYDVPGLTVFK